MARRKFSVESMTDELFGLYTPQKMTQFLSTASEQLKKVARDSLEIVLCGGIGDGHDNKIKGIYFTNENFNAHLRGYQQFKRFVATSNVFIIEIYRRNACVLHHIIIRYDYYQEPANKQELDELNQMICDETPYDSLDALFNQGIPFILFKCTFNKYILIFLYFFFFFCHKKYFN